MTSHDIQKSKSQRYTSVIDSMLDEPVRHHGLQWPLHPRQVLVMVYLVYSMCVFLSIQVPLLAQVAVQTPLLVWGVAWAVLLVVLTTALMRSDPVDRSLLIPPSSESKKTRVSPESLSKDCVVATDATNAINMIDTTNTTNSPVMARSNSSATDARTLRKPYKSNPRYSAMADMARVGQQTDLGDLPSQYCMVCQVYVHIDSLHCRYCNKCIRRIDHHCFYVNNCIGYYNYRLYLQTMTVACVYSITMSAVSIYSLIEMLGSNINVANSGLSLQTFQAINGIDITLSVAVTAYLAYLLLLHLHLCIHGMTTLEYSHKKREQTAARELQLTRQDRVNTVNSCCKTSRHAYLVRTSSCVLERIYK
ncbi:hypothetical protein BASA50_002392 [Batrachochytrium salamandrivorans]|uniref:Palmitoyltransferase n=1 Tax=Batrachochytrium salamandrivorans TaxID=1357716 RepID=A0ABQ8FPF9_9FUNG|nr:hypothetical protein BASA50_002392 [Batrachochytrium salamandrivorans]